MAATKVVTVAVAAVAAPAAAAAKPKKKKEFSLLVVEKYTVDARYVPISTSLEVE
jgi:hypothetical protein